MCFPIPSLNALAAIDWDGTFPGLLSVFTGRATAPAISIRNVYTREVRRNNDWRRLWWILPQNIGWRASKKGAGRRK